MLRSEFADATLQRRAALGRRERAAFDLAQPENFGERPRGSDHLFDRAATA